MARLPEPDYMQAERQRLAGALQAAPEGSAGGPALTTYPMDGPGAVPGPALQMRPVQVQEGSMGQPPPAPAGQAPAGAPPSQPALANPQQAAAPPPMTPIQMIEETPPEVLLETAEQSADVTSRTVKSNPDAAPQVNAALQQAGVNVEEAVTDLTDRLLDKAAKRAKGRESPQYNETEWKNRWKNVFNVIPRDQMGLFLMDFGLRLMAAGGSGQGNLASHIGQAGHGALGGVMERKAASEKTAREAEAEAGKTAATMVGVQLEANRAKLEAAKDKQILPDKIVYDENDAAFFDFGDGKGLTPLTMNGKPIKLSPRDRGKNGSKYAQEIMLENLRAVGYSDREAMDLIQGAPTAAEMRFKFAQTFDDLAFNQSARAAPPGGKQRTRMSEWTPAQRKAWIEQRVAEVSGIAGGNQQNATGVGGNGPRRPPGFNDY